MLYVFQIVQKILCISKSYTQIPYQHPRNKNAIYTTNPPLLILQTATQISASILVLVLDPFTQAVPSIPP